MQKMETYQPQHRRSSSSFSSSLLGAIYDSLDDMSSPKDSRRKAPAGAVNLHFDEPATPIIIKPKPVLTGTPDVVLTKHDSIRYLPDQQIISTKKKLSIITGGTSNKKQRSSSVLSPTSSPQSPGAKIAAFINSLFNASSRVKKQKVSTPSTSCSTSSCLSKKTTTSNRSSVRFSDHDRKERRRILMEELMKEIELMEDESDDDDDLFELVINKNNEKFDYTSMDELPVYGTTDLELNCAIAKGVGCEETHR